MQSGSFRGRRGSSGPHGRVRFPRWRQDAFGRSNAKGGTETGSSDRGVQSVAACGPPRFRDATRCGGDAAGASGTRSRRSDGPAASVCPDRKTGRRKTGRSRPTRRRPGDQVAGSAIFRRLPPCARRKRGSTGLRPPGRRGANHALAGAADSGGFSGDGASRAATGSSMFVGLRFDGWRHRGRNAVHPPPAASSPGCLPVLGWSEGTLSRPRACRLGKASGRIVLRWSHQLRNAGPTPFLYQPARCATTKNSTVQTNYTESVLQRFRFHVAETTFI